ncbi:nose resistant to fluoxetine protein 6 [Caerostris extrusa]|uniref:Nose resistant to fluoxetine protein 6 n=1 Tax=Caerostris extrusa TaxID=172846 RepID=A0AAV4TTF4_CAEEX|nr:nose resistant to fluoxetine protein 6 [Caerostris extrusa]
MTVERQIKPNHAEDRPSMAVDNSPEWLLNLVFLLDSWGKPGGGMFEGNLGHLETMMNASDLEIPELKDPDDSSKHQRGKYCLSNSSRCFPRSLSCTRSIMIYPNYPTLAQKQTSFGATARNAHWFYLLRFRMGACVPSACTAEDVRSIMEQEMFLPSAGMLFCFYTNYLKLITVSVKEDNKHLSAVNGVRYITVTWVIVGHSYLYADYNQMTQGMRLAQLPPNFWFQVVANAMLTVDTFFLMSGMLVTYSVLKAQEKRKGLNVFMYIFHRFWRLTPPYAMTIAFLVLSPILASGPVWKITLDPLIKNCQANWWTNLLYVNNYVNTYDFMAKTRSICGSCSNNRTGSSPLLLISCTTSLPVCSDSSLTQMIEYTLRYLPISNPMLILDLTLLGVRVCGWLFFSALQCTVLYGVYRWNNGAPYTPLIATLYAGTSKLVWSFGIFWMLLVCLTGNGGIINRILSWKFWVPMARLSYVFYLLHPLVIWVHEAFAHSNTYTSHYFWVYNILGHYMVTMVLSLIVSLTFEAPFLALEKILFGGGGNRSNREGQTTPPLKKVPELPSYDSELRPRSFTNGKQQHYPEGHTNGGYRNGGEGLYRPNRENGVGQQRGQENGAFCRL